MNDTFNSTPTDKFHLRVEKVANYLVKKLPAKPKNIYFYHPNHCCSWLIIEWNIADKARFSKFSFNKYKCWWKKGEIPRLFRIAERLRCNPLP